MRHGSEVGGERIRALALLRRGLGASPELRRGAGITLGLALVAGGGRVITPVLVQQAIDRHNRSGVGSEPLAVRIALASFMDAIVAATPGSLL